MKTLETYILANLDILQNSLDNVKKEEYASENMIKQLETLSRQAMSFVYWIRNYREFGIKGGE